MRLDVIVPQSAALPEPDESLGIAISRSLAEILGGRLEIPEPSAHGVVFRLELPGESVDATAPERPPAPAPAAGCIEAVAGCRVLVIDDNADNLRLVRHFLSRAGARVTCCEGGEQGLEAVRAAEFASQPFQVVLLDIQMPHMDGHQVARALRERGFQAALIAFTAHSMATERERCLRSGFDDYATKPIDRLALLELIGGHAAGLAERASAAPQAQPSAIDISSGLSPWERFVQRCLPSEERSNPVELRRLGTLLSIGLLGLPLTLIQGLLIGYVFPRPISQICVALLAAIVPLQALNVLVYRWTGSSRVSAHVLLGFLCFQVAFIAYCSGGVTSPAGVWGVLIPLIGVGLLRWRATAFWTSISMLLPLTFYIATQLVGPLTDHTLPELRPFAHIVGASALMAQVVAVMLAYENGRSDALKTLAAADVWLADARAQGRRAERVKSEFLSRVSHELLAPMTGVLGHVDLILQRWQSGKTDADRIELLRTVRRNAQGLSTLIHDLLDLSRLEIGQLRIASVSFAPAQVLCRSLEPLRARAETAGLTLTLALDTPIPGLVRGDPTRLQRVLRGLGENALKFTDAGRIHASVGAEERSGTRGLCFRVADTGRGISREDLTRVVQPFRQVDPSATREHGGGGLGLTLSRRLIDAMQGALEIESALGRGSVFSVWLPCIEEPGAARVDALPQSAGGAPSTVEEAPAASERPLLGHRLLLADSEIDHRILIARMLEAAGACVDVARDPEALVVQTPVSSADAERHDVILLGLEPRDPSGERLIQELRASGCTDPILVLTTYSPEEEPERYRVAGCDEIVRKPIDAPQLIASIRRLRDSRKTAS